jgi:cytoskeletal protein CcmA (bactofilin family)
MTPAEGSTIIGKSLKVRGEFTGTDDLFVDGEIDGIIRLPAARLTVRAEGKVRATIVAQDVVVMGRVEGEIRATGRLELRAGAVVVGDVFATRLSMEEGAMLRGSVDPTKAAENVAEAKPDSAVTA